MSLETLLKQDLIKKCSVDWKAVNSLIKRAYADLKTAERNIDDDMECAYNYAYNAMRKKRNQFIYEPDIPCSKREAEEALRTAKGFVDAISKLIKDEHPQIKFGF